MRWERSASSSEVGGRTPWGGDAPALGSRRWEWRWEPSVPGTREGSLPPVVTGPRRSSYERRCQSGRSWCAGLSKYRRASPRSGASSVARSSRSRSLSGFTFALIAGTLRIETFRRPRISCELRSPGRSRRGIRWAIASSLPREAACFSWQSRHYDAQIWAVARLGQVAVVLSENSATLPTARPVRGSCRMGWLGCSRYRGCDGTL
jgi:hypothetical protein